MVVLLFGPPGCGKGTQARFVESHLRVPAISTGEMLRREVAAASDLGNLAQEIMLDGGLVSDDLVNQILVRRLQDGDCHRGFLLDGYPRTVGQAVFLDELLDESHHAPAQVVHLAVRRETLVARMSARRQCPVCGQIYNTIHQPPLRTGLCDVDGTVLIRRKDDHESIIRQRLQAYDQVTVPLLDYYGSTRIWEVAGDQPPNDIFSNICRKLSPLLVADLA